MVTPFYPMKYMMEKTTQSYFSTRVEWYITYKLSCSVDFWVFYSLKNINVFSYVLPLKIFVSIFPSGTFAL